MVVSAEYGALNAECGRFPEGDIHGGCGKRVQEGDRVAYYWMPYAKNPTAPYCEDCEPAHMKEDEYHEWEWDGFDGDAWESMLAGYMDMDQGPSDIDDKKELGMFGTRIHTAVEVACYYDSLEILLRGALPFSDSSDTPKTLSEWYQKHPIWLQGRTKAVDYIQAVALNPVPSEREWARFWGSVFEEAGISLDKYLFLSTLFQAGYRCDRFELLFSEEGL